MQHVIRMSATNAIGLTALFLVDLVDIYFISLLGEYTYTAAIGYASALMFLTTSISIAFVTVNSAFVSKAIGANKPEESARYISSIACFAVLITSIIAATLWILAPFLLQKMGAEGAVLAESISYLRIIVPALPILAIAMQMGGTLRSLGAAKHAMYATLGGGLINALLDPIFIFVFKLDLHGAAIASLISRITFFSIFNDWWFIKGLVSTSPIFSKNL